MKINWGGGLVIGMIAFMGFILYLVITMMTSDEYSHDLVTEEYYKKDLQYQNEIDAETNTALLSEGIVSKRSEDGWLIRFPEELDANHIKGSVSLYRPSNEKLDFDLPLVLSGSELLIPDKKLIEGRWNITLRWEYKGKEYQYRDSITY